MLGNLLGGFITILIGVNLMPPIADGVFTARYVDSNSSRPSNVTGTTATITGLVPLFFALGIMAAGVAVTTAGLRNAGVL